ncbi:glycosyltransferase [Halomonas sp. GDM18]|nr:glycosyltransferase [Halomonas sp. GDM18]
MEVLILTNMFPDLHSPMKGVFVREQVVELRKRTDWKINLFNIDSLRSKAKLKYLYSVFYILTKLIKHKPKIIVVHYGLSWLPLVILYPYIKLNKISIVTFYHGSDVLGSKVVRFISKIGSKLSSHSICVSKEIATKLNAKNSIILPLPVDDNLLSLNLHRKHNYRGFLKLIFPSNPSRVEKNYSFFCEVISLLEKENVKVKKIIFHNKGRAQVIEDLSNSDALLLTSDREGSPQVVKEAIACNCKVVSRPVGDVAESYKLVEGVYIESTPLDFAQRILEIIKEPAINEQRNWEYLPLASTIYPRLISLINRGAS